MASLIRAITIFPAESWREFSESCSWAWTVVPAGRLRAAGAKGSDRFVGDTVPGMGDGAESRTVGGEGSVATSVSGAPAAGCFETVSGSGLGEGIGVEAGAGDVFSVVLSGGALLPGDDAWGRDLSCRGRSSGPARGGLLARRELAPLSGNASSRGRATRSTLAVS